MIPRKPGVYIFKERTGKVLYVGKAVDLKSRVSSYFSGAKNSKPAELVSHIAGIETIITESELEALILEANLIKKYLPPFNVKLIDDKDYLYIAVTRDEFPKITTERKSRLQTARRFWGPFPSARTVKDTLKSLRKVFPWCSAPHSIRLQGDALERNRPCFYYHLSLCPGSCIGMISKNDYQKIISRFSKFMDGKKDQMIKELQAEMTKVSSEQKFEEAGRIKKILEGITYLTQPNRVKLYLENPNFLEAENNLALKSLQQDLKLKNLPERIEGYDISNIQGQEATGSMVVLTHGEIDKTQYRKFKIRPASAGSGRPNDVGMMREMVQRRLKHQEWPLPDLIIVDGGRGQVRVAKFEILNLKFEIPLFGLAKKREWLYPPEGEVLKLPKHSLSLKLLQKLRDEAHRFAISYHRKLHGKIMLII